MTLTWGPSRAARSREIGSLFVALEPNLLDGETRNRTGDTTIFSRVLYQLSYLAVAVRLAEGGSAGAAASIRPISSIAARLWR